MSKLISLMGVSILSTVLVACSEEVTKEDVAESIEDVIDDQDVTAEEQESSIEAITIENEKKVEEHNQEMVENQLSTDGLYITELTYEQWMERQLVYVQYDILSYDNLYLAVDDPNMSDGLYYPDTNFDEYVISRVDYSVHSIAKEIITYGTDESSYDTDGVPEEYQSDHEAFLIEVEKYSELAKLIPYYHEYGDRDDVMEIIDDMKELDFNF